MKMLSENTKQELFKALNGKQSGVFVIDGKLVSIEFENNENTFQNDDLKDLSQEIDEYPELKKSLSRYLANSGMKRYTRSELKSRRNEQRRK